MSIASVPRFPTSGNRRHSGPSAPWPWVNTEDEVDNEQLRSEAHPIPELCSHVDCNDCWKGYPQSRFPNWTPFQVRRSQILHAIDKVNQDIPYVIYHIDVDNRGYFMDSGKYEVTEQTKGDFWKLLIHHQRPMGTRVRALFVENMSGPVLQMLGTKYNIEPFFFSSLLSWIPSRFQEEVQPGTGDHITITLRFFKTMGAVVASDRSSTPSTTPSTTSEDFLAREQVIDTQVPLVLRTGDRCTLVCDLLAIHLIRNVEGNTLISYHANMSAGTETSTQYLHERILFAGQSVYWQRILQRSSQDPTFILLMFIWHAVYSWDEAFEALYTHICWLEGHVLDPHSVFLTNELHNLRAHHLHFTSSLEDLRKSVLFILNTPNPAMDNLPQWEREFSRILLQKECQNLLSEVDRLEMNRRMQDERIKNYISLVFITANIYDNKHAKKLTESAAKDSAVMKQIAFLTMVFLPFSFVATIFGMNVGEFNPDSKGTLLNFFEIAVALTLLTIWVVMAFMTRHLFMFETTFWLRFLWPWMLLKQAYRNRKREGGPRV
ncbi:uncharacterized protein EV420DRAFT_1688707 [Desarmillaria tabescens]|uniref:Uncharacterized protein n=1 Tax=Armillaria tabescens TaxID=1929756 RepID=A0AA39KAB1_ARMTA|nr:uncharacterized protein EV420DRAFT_1688707 [Desarmillaria tabescens]KAK0457484.1 hypothetical protein EV420DRAFT_1688707 [Desarmillaria tabescens]